MTKSIPKGYKQTEIGIIPDDWEVNKFGKIVDIKKGQLITDSTRIDGSIPVIAGGKTPAYYHNKANRFGKTITISCSGANAGYIAFHTYPIFASDCSTIEESKRYSIEYIYYLLQSFQEKIYKMQTGGAQPHIHPSDLEPIIVSIPKLIEEQSAISQILSDTDLLIESLDKLIEKKKNIKQGAMQELLTGRKRLIEFSGEWKEKELGEIATFEHGRGLFKSDITEYGRYQCIHYGELFTEYKELIKKIKNKTNHSQNMFFSKINDVLIPTSDVTPNGLATASCINEENVILGGGILIVRLNKDYDGVFLSYYVTNNKNKILKLVKGSTVFHIYATDLKKLEIYAPLAKEEQASIVAIILDMDAEIEQLEKERDKYKKIKIGMMQELLTGRIRLK